MTRYPLAPAFVVPPPPVPPANHGLIVSSTQIDDGEDRWEMGFTFWPENCVAPASWWPGCDSENTAGQDGLGSPSGNAVTKSDPPVNNPVQIYLPPTFESSFECNSAGWSSIDYPGRAQRQVQLGLPNSVEYEFWTGTLVPENYNLVGSCPASAADNTGGILNASSGGLWTAMKPQDALAALVGALASCGAGVQGMIHAPAVITELWAETFSLIPDGPRLRTKTRGNVVVSGGGYPGTGPAGLAGTSAASQASPTGAAWVYTSSMVATRVANPVVYPSTLAEAFVIDANGRRSNQIRFLGEQVAAAYCAACCTFACLVDTSGGS